MRTLPEITQQIIQLTLLRPKLSESQPQIGQPTAIPTKTVCNHKETTVINIASGA